MISIYITTVNVQVEVSILIAYCRSSQPYSCHSHMDVPPQAHFPRGQWIPVGRREALTGKNKFYNFFNAVVISCPPLKRPHSTLGGNSSQLEIIGVEGEIFPVKFGCRQPLPS